MGFCRKGGMQVHDGTDVVPTRGKILKKFNLQLLDLSFLECTHSIVFDWGNQ